MTYSKGESHLSYQFFCNHIVINGLSYGWKTPICNRIVINFEATCQFICVSRAWFEFTHYPDPVRTAPTPDENVPQRLLHLLVTTLSHGFKTSPSCGLSCLPGSIVMYHLVSIPRVCGIKLVRLPFYMELISGIASSLSLSWRRYCGLKVTWITFIASA
jgi:hypothetical protein